jgi:hypothetical protein
MPEAMKFLSEEEEHACQQGAAWVGANHLSEHEFHAWFGVYPSTVVAISRLCGVADADIVRVFWWMHHYPTRKEIKAKRVSASRFVRWVWETIALLDGLLSEVSIYFSLLF